MLRIGSTTVIALDDGQGPFFEPRAQAFSTATAADWRHADAADPRARGHTPGHQCALLDTGTDRVLVTGDLLVHAVQLIEPALPYAHEMDPATAAASRTALLRDLAARPGSFTLATAHLGEAFTAGK